MAFCASTRATAVATSDAGRSRRFLFMFLPLSWPVFPGDVVAKSVSALGKYRKCEPFVAMQQHGRVCLKSVFYRAWSGSLEVMPFGQWLRFGVVP
jgi:hypothetical protein